MIRRRKKILQRRYLHLLKIVALPPNEAHSVHTYAMLHITVNLTFIGNVSSEFKLVHS